VTPQPLTDIPALYRQQSRVLHEPKPGDTAPWARGGLKGGGRRIFSKKTVSVCCGAAFYVCVQIRKSKLALPTAWAEQQDVPPSHTSAEEEKRHRTRITHVYTNCICRGREYGHQAINLQVIMQVDMHVPPQGTSAIMPVTGKPQSLRGNTLSVSGVVSRAVCRRRRLT